MFTILTSVGSVAGKVVFNSQVGNTSSEQRFDGLASMIFCSSPLYVGHKSLSGIRTGGDGGNSGSTTDSAVTLVRVKSMILCTFSSKNFANATHIMLSFSCAGNF